MLTSLRSMWPQASPCGPSAAAGWALFDLITLLIAVKALAVGWLPGHVTMQSAWRRWALQQLAWRGHTLRGYTFHYSTSDSSAPVVARTARPNEAVAPTWRGAVPGRQHPASHFPCVVPVQPRKPWRTCWGLPV